MNIFQLAVRYGAVIAKYGAYLKFLPFVYNLVIFIRQAQARFTEAGTGPQRLQWARDEFVRMVTSAEGVGLIQPESADVLRDGAEALINAVVRAMKEAGGVRPLADPHAVIDIVPLMGSAGNQPATPTSAVAPASSATPGVQTA